MRKMPRTIHKACTIALATLVAMALTAPVQAASYPSDAWITTKVKLALLTSDGVSVNDVSVDTVARQVTLHGTVRTQAEKDAAEVAAKSVEGSQAVRNLLQVVAAKDEVAVEEKDEAIQQHVATALKAEPSLESSSISVQSVNKGVVLLKGRAHSLGDHLTAVEVARSIPGVRRVASEVESPDALADAAIWKEEAPVASATGAVKPALEAAGAATAEAAAAAGQAVADSARRTRSAVTDLYTTSMVKLSLLADPATPAMDINVDTRRGVVTLFGIVPTEASRTAAEADANKVSGVESVRNRLEVVPSPALARVEMADEVIATGIREALSGRSEFSNVDVEVRNSAVRLTGSVSSGIDRVEAMQIARSAKGAGSVTDGLTIK